MHFWGSIKTLGQGHGYGYITSGQNLSSLVEYQALVSGLSTEAQTRRQQPSNKSSLVIICMKNSRKALDQRGQCVGID